MTLQPAVSVLMPVRNEERFLPAAIRSILCQSLSNLELVIVDDGSTDRTPSIIVEAAAQDSRVTAMHSGGRGLVDSLNLGLGRCSAPLIARMDGDDISHPARLQCQAEFLNSARDVGLVACSARHFPRQGLKSGMLNYERWQHGLISHEEIVRDIYVESPFVHPAVMFRSETVKSVNGYREMGWAEDYDLWLRLAAAGIRFARIPRKLLMWRDRPERATRTMEQYTADSFRRCKLHHLKKGFLSGETDVILAGAGREGRAWQRILFENGINVIQWIDVDARKTGRILHGAPVTPASDWQPDSGRKMLVTIGIAGARVQVREWAESLGLRDGKDFVCVS